MMKRKVKVTITKIQRKGILNKTPDNRLFCPICAESVETISFNEIIELLQIDIETLQGLVKSEKFHLILKPEGDYHLCRYSLHQNNFEMFLNPRH